MMQIIYEKASNQIFDKFYNREKQEALEMIIFDAGLYIKTIKSLPSQILPYINLELFHFHLYPELRDLAFHEAMKPARMKVKQNTLMREVKGRLAERMPSIVLQEIVT